MITVDHLTKQFGRFTALDDVSFSIAPGEAVALWGPNGAGKTTAIRCILGLIRCRGSILINGKCGRKHSKAARRSLGYVPQELCLHDDLSAIEALHFFARLKRVGGERPAAVLAEVGLEAHGRKRIRELSGGMKQRLALAIALLADPPLLVLDELTSNLDSAAQASFMTLLRDLKRERGKTILFTSHHLDEIEMLADRVLVLEAGSLKLECSPGELAETLGLRRVLKLTMAHDVIGSAVEILRGRGFIAQPNGTGLHVEVPARAKASAMRTLMQASIDVRDFEFVDEIQGNGRQGAAHV